MDECQRLTRAIDAYIAKADGDLADILTDEGYADATETVNRAARIEADVAEALDDELNAILTAAERSVDLKEFANSVWQGVKLNDTLAEKIFVVFQEQLSEFLPELVSTYLTQTDKQLTLTSISQRTTAWVDDWSEELGGLMKLTTHNEIQTILKSGLESGASLQTFTNAILDSGIRDTRYRARRVAITEVLRAHSVAREESIQQSPAVTQKEWVHTGSYRNEPRPNHVAISGTVIPKDEAFTLIGADGATYYPQYPRDTSLPASESVNCHCIHRGIADEKVLGLSLEERRRLQQEAIDEMDDDWKKELDAKNKAKAGIESDVPDSKRGEKTELGRVSSYDKEAQIKYMGGKAKWTLYASGTITDDEMLQKVKSATLKELRNDGIITISPKTAEHSNLGTFKPPTAKYPQGRMTDGGHGQTSFDEMTAKGIDKDVKLTFTNGVRLGSVPSSAAKFKRDGGQSWFPESWDEDKIRVAGTFVANSPAPIQNGYQKIDVYDGVAVRILYDQKTGKITTICPDLDQDTHIEGVKRL